MKSDIEIAREGYEAMVVFLERFWERDGRPDDSLALLLSFAWPVGVDRRPADPAMWQDWLAAIEIARKAASDRLN